MNSSIGRFWEIRLADVKKVLEKNNFEVFVARNVSDARRIVLEEIIPRTRARSVSWGGSLTFRQTGLYEILRDSEAFEVLDTFEADINADEKRERRTQALLVDLFITGTNAVTETGVLVNLDMIGNRVAALTFGPRNVIVLIGRNKIVADVADAMVRVRNYAAPANAMRLGKKVPCATTSYCDDCESPDRICNTWTITEKSYPKGRISVVMINEDLGL